MATRVSLSLPRARAQARSLREWVAIARTDGPAARRRLALRLGRVAAGLPGPEIALTFDDGPDPRFTPQVLDVLARHRVNATFFFVGARARAHPAIVARALAEGHAVGSHGDVHRDARTTRLPALARDFRRGRRAIEEIAGRRVTLFRPPNGHVSVRAALAFRFAGLRPWLWSVDPEDWRPDANATGIVASAADVDPGDVVLLHDALARPTDPRACDRSATVAALDGLITQLRDRGFEFVVLPS
jgi:peptidoglycan/xylan/chitin deacetylase (PgdA/CDA1 family)